MCCDQSTKGHSYKILLQNFGLFLRNSLIIEQLSFVLKNVTKNSYVGALETLTRRCLEDTILSVSEIKCHTLQLLRSHQSSLGVQGYSVFASLISRKEAAPSPPASMTDDCLGFEAV